LLLEIMPALTLHLASLSGLFPTVGCPSQ